MARRRRRSKKAQQGAVGLLLLFALFSFLLAHVTIFFTVVGLLIAGFGAWIFLKGQARANLARSGIDTIDRMDGATFERYLAALFAKLGYKKARATRVNGDFGADVVMERDGERHVVQAKRYTGNVGVAAVQEIVAAKAHYYATHAWVVTNAHFTPAAISLASSNGVRLVDRDALVKLILSSQEEEKKAGRQAHGASPS